MPYTLLKRTRTCTLSILHIVAMLLVGLLILNQPVRAEGYTKKIPTGKKLVCDKGKEARRFFPESKYPYVVAPNGCDYVRKSMEGKAAKIAAFVGWPNVNDVCDNHDRCYFTVGSRAVKCNEDFKRGLRSRCHKRHCLGNGDLFLQACGETDMPHNGYSHICSCLFWCALGVS